MRTTMNNHIEKPPFLKRKQGHFAKGTRFKAKPMATIFQFVATKNLIPELKQFTPIKGYFPLGGGLLLAFLFWFIVGTLRSE